MGKQQERIWVSAHNLIHICVDVTENGEIGGRIYHCYHDGALLFDSVVDLIREMECVLDSSAFPQASTKPRYFVERKAAAAHEQMELVMTQEEVLAQKGKKGTFATCIQFRQKATWQGNVYCMENHTGYTFQNELDLIKIIYYVMGLDKE